MYTHVYEYVAYLLPFSIPHAMRRALLTSLSGSVINVFKMERLGRRMGSDLVHKQGGHPFSRTDDEDRLKIDCDGGGSNAFRNDAILLPVRLKCFGYQ